MGATGSLLASIDRREVLVVNLDEETTGECACCSAATPNLPLDFVDAAVVAIAERLEQTKVATLGSRFSVIRPLHMPAFELVPSLD